MYAKHSPGEARCCAKARSRVRLTAMNKRGRNTFAANIADDEAEVLRIKQKEIEKITANFFSGDHGGVQLKILAIGEGGELVRQNGLLNLRGMRQFLRAQFLGLFHFDEAGVLNADGGHVSHDGEQVEILSGEFLNKSGRIEIDEAADAIFGLQRHGQHAADLLRDDTFAGGQGLMPQGIANQERTPLVKTKSRTRELMRNPAPFEARTRSSPPPQGSSIRRERL